ncbi:MAG TPA: hypothetical protein V6D12_04805 [Candidatus Obscuribacterales bacterium]
MNDNHSYEKWQKIKNLATRLHITSNLLQFFDNQIKELGVADKLQPIRDQLQAEFTKALNNLIEIIENDEN